MKTEILGSNGYETSFRSKDFAEILKSSIANRSGDSASRHIKIRHKKLNLNKKENPIKASCRLGE